MKDNEISRVFIKLLKDGFVKQVSVDPIYSNIKILRAYQPTKQGIESGAAIYFQKITDTRVGAQARSEAINSSGDMVRTASQLYESSYQFTGYVRETPVTTSFTPPITASDVINTAAMILQSFEAIESLAKIGAGVLRIGSVRTPYFVNDRDNFEVMPNFDVILSYTRQMQIVIPSTKTAEYNIYRV